MTPQEAIKDIKENIMPVTGSPSLILAIESLEKQIPRRPIRKKWKISECPCCGKKLGEWLEDGYHKDYETMKVCDCGQHLDWSYPERCEKCDEYINDDEDRVDVVPGYIVCKECYSKMYSDDIDEIIKKYG